MFWADHATNVVLPFWPFTASVETACQVSTTLARGTAMPSTFSRVSCEYAFLANSRYLRPLIFQRHQKNHPFKVLSHPWLRKQYENPVTVVGAVIWPRIGDVRCACVGYHCLTHGHIKVPNAICFCGPPLSTLSYPPPSVYVVTYAHHGRFGLLLPAWVLECAVFTVFLLSSMP